MSSMASSSPAPARLAPPPPGPALPPEGSFSFFLLMLDDLRANDWYSEQGIVPLLPAPEDLDRLAEAYCKPLHNIIKSRLIHTGVVDKVYVHFGCGGLFEINPNSKLFGGWLPSKFKAILYELLQKRRLVEPDGVIVARELRTTEEVHTLYEGIRRNYHKIGCVTDPSTDDRSIRWDELEREIIPGQPVMFLFGKTAYFMEYRRIVDRLVIVPANEFEHIVDTVVTEVQGW